MDQDDLTASHWDDVISPNKTAFTNLTSSYLPSFNNEFNELSINDRNAEDQEEEQDKQGQDGERNQAEEYDPEQDQLNDLRKEERKEHKQNLITELTNGSEENELENSFIASPKKVNVNDSLFNDKDSPIKINNDDNKNIEELQGSPKRANQLKNGKFKVPRIRRYNSKTVSKHLNENNIEPPLSAGPLGNNETEDDSISNDKSSVRSNTKADQLVHEANAPLYDVPQISDEERLKSLSKPKKIENTVSKETNEEKEGSKFNPLIEISVGDPMKVGDITTAHIVYSIKIRIKNSNDERWKKFDKDEILVTRRYKDFRWIYHQLQNNHPGKIIPPPPAKQTYIGRFNENFIENRRLSLEKMLNKIANIEKLYYDDDFMMFLTSEDFINESKERERLSGLGASMQNNEFLDNDGDSNKNGNEDIVVAPIVGNGGNSGGGFMSSFFSMSNKINEPDEYFINKKTYIEDMEYNLKNFYKSLELIGNQRLEMIGVIDEISITIEELSTFEISKITSELLNSFSEVQIKLKENLDRINLQDQLTLGFTIEEYLRIIGSIKFTFETRLKIHQQYYNFQTELNKKQSQLDKLNKKYKSSIDKINQLSFEVDKLKQKTSIYEKNFNNISETIKEELENFEIERIDDFRNSVEIFIESSIEAQKEAIELWETFYERQNLAAA